jgi:hypothetical protein
MLRKFQRIQNEILFYYYVLPGFYWLRFNRKRKSSTILRRLGNDLHDTTSSRLPRFISRNGYDRMSMEPNRMRLSLRNQVDPKIIFSSPFRGPYVLVPWLFVFGFQLRSSQVRLQKRSLTCRAMQNRDRCTPT